MKRVILLWACGLVFTSSEARAQQQNFAPYISLKTAFGVAQDDLVGEVDVDAGFNWRATSSTTIAMNLEARDRLTEASYAELVGATGSLTGFADGTTGGPLFRLDKLWVRQTFNGGDTSVTLGRLHFEDHFLDNGLSSKSAVAFANEAFSAKPGVAFPRDAMGFAASSQITSIFSVSLVLGDGRREREFDVFASGEIFAAGEFTVALDPFGWGAGQYRFGVWSRTLSSDFGPTEANGLAVSIDQPIGAGAVVMGRYFENSGGLRPAEQGWAIGVGADMRALGRQQDQAGVGFASLVPTEEGHGDQRVTEVYYRWQLNRVAAVTPSLQYTANDDDSESRVDALYTGVRLRVRYPN